MSQIILAFLIWSMSVMRLDFQSTYYKSPTGNGYIIFNHLGYVMEAWDDGGNYIGELGNEEPYLPDGYQDWPTAVSSYYESPFLGLGIGTSTNDEIRFFRILIPDCCEDGSLGEVLPFLTINYDLYDDEWSIRFRQPNNVVGSTTIIGWSDRRGVYSYIFGLEENLE